MQCLGCLDDVYATDLELCMCVHFSEVLESERESWKRVECQQGHRWDGAQCRSM